MDGIFVRDEFDLEGLGGVSSCQVDVAFDWRDLDVLELAKTQGYE